jgi:hypothetical protein
MKPFIPAVAVLSLGAGPLCAQSESVYTNFIRQVQFPALENGEYLEKDVSVESIGTQLSPLAITSGGARFELWAVRTSHQSEYLLDSSFVGTYVPTASVSISTEDPYTTIPRTRADRAFTVNVTVSGLLTGDTLPDGTAIPDAAKKVNFLHHVQSYGAGGTGENINRDNATLSETTTITSNVEAQQQSYVVTIPASDLTKVRGEERFSLYSLDDYQAPASQLASQFVQIWPVADGSISGITNGQKVLFAMPQISLTLNDLYPKSSTYLQAYKGNAVLGTTGTVVPGSSIELSDTVPKSEVLTLTSSSWNEILDKDGVWTLELVTKTPFDTVRLAYVTFTLDRTIEVNSNITTSD